MSESLLQSYKQTAQASIEDAISLPFAVYHDPDVYSAELDAVFRNEWVFVCAEQQLPEAGDYFAFTLAGEAVVIIRGQDNQVRALSNNCRHRGTPLLDEGFGRINRNIICPYHAWTYDDKGVLKAVTFPGEVQVNKDAHCLPQFHLEQWLGLLFVNLSGKPYSFAQRIQGIDKYTSIFEPERFTEGYHGDKEQWQANWKLAVENGIESYHLFKVHKDTLETITPSKSAFYVAGSSEWSVTAGRMADNRSKLSKWLSGDHPEAHDHYLLIFLPPSFVGIITYESFDWIHILPDGTEQCSVQAGGIFERGLSKKDDAQMQFANAFLEEDKIICERVQKGMHSQQGYGGKLVSMEKILVDFRQFLASWLFDTQPDVFMESDKTEIFQVNLVTAKQR